MRKRIGFILISISLLLTACGHEHVFSTATCTTPATCTECGKTQGTVADHNFISATCTEPKKCSNCGITEGNALGHTTDLGKCENCAEIQGKDTLDSIYSYVKSGFSKANSGMDTITYSISMSYEDLYDDVCTSVNYFNNAKSDFNSAIDLCGNHPELATLKSKLQAVVNACPGKPSAATSSALNSWTSEYEAVLNSLDSLSTEANNFARTYNLR